jgi:hypothetical protein
LKLVESTVVLCQDEELNLMFGHFLERALYCTVKGYEVARAEAG